MNDKLSNRDKDMFELTMAVHTLELIEIVLQFLINIDLKPDAKFCENPVEIL